MARQRENRESREGFLIPEYSGKVTGTQRGGYQTASIMWESDTVRWQMISRKRTENRGWKQCAVQDFLARDGDPQPQDRSKFIVKSGSKQMGSLGGVSISLLSISTIPNPELSSIQCMKNITVMIQNKHLFAHIIICYFLVSTNVRILFPPNWLSLIKIMVLHLSRRTADNQERTKWKCHISKNDVSYSW